MKKLNLLIGAMASITLMSGITSCGGSRNSSLSDKAKQNVEILTGIKLLETSFSSGTKIQKVTNVNETEDEIAQLLPSIDALLNNGTVIKTNIENVKNEINGVTYNFKEVMNYKDANLNDASYVLYYNKTGKTISEPFDFDKEVTTYEKLEGVVEMESNNFYPFVSRSVTESEDNETETERVLTINIDSDTYVKVVEENEFEGRESEVEFSYTLVDNGRRLNYSISIENESNQFDEIEYKLNGVEYEVTKVRKDGEIVYRVEKEGRNEIEKVYYYKKIVLDDGNSKFERI